MIAVFLERIRQAGKLLWVEFLARLAGVGFDVLNGNFNHATACSGGRFEILLGSEHLNLYRDRVVFLT